MANSLLCRFTLNNAISPWSAGDIIESYWDDVAEGVVCYRNSSLEASGPTINNYEITGESTYLQFCEGTTLTTFNTLIVPRSRTAPLTTLDFPYAERIETPASSSCQASPYICKMRLNIIKITRPSVGGSDGEIQIIAFDSNTGVEYSSTDFLIGDGENSDGVFSSLAAGTYNLYARDQYNCGAKVTVVLKDEPAYSTIYRVEFYDLLGNVNRFDIEKKNYAGSVTEINSGGYPLVYNKFSSGLEDFFKSPINSSAVDVELMSTSNFQFRNLFTQDNREYRGVWYLNTGGGLAEKWRGFSIPDVFSEPYISTPYPTKLTFADGLESLKFIEYTENGQYYHGDDHLLKIISRCLLKTGLNLEINIGVNLYSATMSSGVGDGPFDQCYLSNETLYREGIPFNCFEVVEAILKPFGARVFQWENKWWITRKEEERGTSYDYRTYDQYGISTTGNSSLSPRLNIDEATASTRFVWSERSQIYEILPAYKELFINSLNNRKEGLFNGDFSLLDLTETVPMGWLLKSNNTTGVGVEIRNDANYLLFRNARTGNADFNDRTAHARTETFDMSLALTDQFEISFDVGVDRLSTSIPFMVVKWQFVVTVNSITYYLLEDGNWSTSAYYNYYNPKPTNKSTFSIKTTLPSAVTGINSDGKYDAECALVIYPYLSQGYTYSSLANLQGATSTQLDGGIGVDVLYDVYGDQSKFDILFYKTKISDEAASGITIVRPTDFHATTNAIVYELEGSINHYYSSNRPASGRWVNKQHFIGHNEIFYLSNVNVNVYSNNAEIPSDETVSSLVDEDYTINYNLDLIFNDIPKTTSGGRVSNDVNLFDNFFKLASQDYIDDWVRDGQAESDTIQRILLKQLINQYKEPTSKLSGSLTNLGGSVYLAPYNTLVETFDGSKIYYVDGLTYNAKSCEYNVDLIELKETYDATIAAHTSGFKLSAFT